jgi:hypothetical protein
MNISGIGQLGELLRGQRRHDEHAHRDVYYLSSVHRMTHLTQHVSKYAARLLPERRNTGRDLHSVERTVVDTTLIALSAAELLRIDLMVLYPPELAIVDLSELGRYRAALLGAEAGAPHWFLHRLIAIAGDMSKALESLDHLEAYPYRETLNRCAVQLLETCLVTAAMRDLDLMRLIHLRWQELEQSTFAENLGLEESHG